MIGEVLRSGSRAVWGTHRRGFGPAGAGTFRGGWLD